MSNDKLIQNLLKKRILFLKLKNLKNLQILETPVRKINNLQVI